MLISTLVASTVPMSTAARADDARSCATQTTRAPGEILVPLDDAPGSPLGVSIHVGETICLTGAITHGRLEPRLVDSDGVEPALVEVSLEASGPITILTVRSSSDRAMRVLPAVITGPANIALPADAQRLDPHGTAIQPYSRWIHGVLLREVHLLEPPPRMELVPLDERWGQASLQGLVGVRRLAVSAFDAPLRASGYAPLPRSYVGGGLLLDFSLWRWRFGVQVFYGQASAPSLLDASSASAGVGASVGASVGDVSFDVGYDLLRWQGLTLFAEAGLGVSALMIDTRDPRWSYVARSTGVGSDVGTVEQDALLLGAQLGLEQIVPLGRASPGENYALVLSLRGGYEQQFANLGWETSNSDSKSLGGLPLVDLGGGWASLGIGFGVYSATSRLVRTGVPQSDSP